MATAGAFLRGRVSRTASRRIARRAAKDALRMKNISAWAIRHPITPIVLFVVLFFLGIGRLHPPAHQPDAGHRLSAGEVRSRSPAPRRRRWRPRSRRRSRARSRASATCATSPRYIIEGLRSKSYLEFQIGTPDRPCRHRRARRGGQGAQRSAAGNPGAPGPAHRTSTAAPIAYYAVTTTTLTPEQLSWFIDNTVTKRLLAVPGVAQVSRSGGVEPRDPRRARSGRACRRSASPPYEVNEQLRELNLDAAGGRAQVGGGEQAIRVLGGANGAATGRHADHGLPGGRACACAKSPTCTTASPKSARISRLNGRPATTFGVFKAKGASDVAVLDAVQAELDKIATENPGSAASRRSSPR